MKHKWKESTQILYEGSEIEGEGLFPESPPIYHSTAYIIEDMDDYDKAARGEKYYYSRTANPNRDLLSSTISFLEGAENTVICSSGMAAISTTLFTFAKQGDHIIVSKSIYGETIELMDRVLKPLGIEITYVDFTNLDQIKKSMKENTVAVYTEIIANPLITVVDIEKISKIAHDNKLIVIVDSTFTTPYVNKPLKHGADIVIQSLTKFYNGHSDVTAGSISASKEIINKIIQVQLLLGGCGDPNSSWMILRSIRTMDLRVKRQLENAEKLAEILSNHPSVKYVNYPSLKNHPQHELAKRIFEHGYGAMLSFRVEDNREKVNAFMHKLQLVKYLGTLGGYRTTIAHPATAFRLEFTQEELIEMGMDEGLIRISIGIEDIEDLIYDFSQALEVFCDN